MRKLTMVTTVLPLVLLAFATPASAADNATVVSHGPTHTEIFPDDICGPRANTTTFTAKVSQWQLIERSDGSFSYRDVAVVTYTSDYVDPALPDLTGRLTEVNHFILTQGGTFIATTTFHDFFGDVKIHYRLNIKEVDGTVVVEREILDVTGCP